jgi:SOS-response transcriptional repressor LexA
MIPNIEQSTLVRPAHHLHLTPVKPYIECVYEFIIRYKRTHDGNSPTIREIGSGCGITSTSVVTYWLKKLETRSLILLPEDPGDKHPARRIEVIGGHWEMEEK